MKKNNFITITFAVLFALTLIMTACTKDNNDGKDTTNASTTTANVTTADTTTGAIIGSDSVTDGMSDDDIIGGDSGDDIIGDDSDEGIMGTDIGDAVSETNGITSKSIGASVGTDADGIEDKGLFPPETNFGQSSKPGTL